MKQPHWFETPLALEISRWLRRSNERSLIAFPEAEYPEIYGLRYVFQDIAQERLTAWLKNRRPGSFLITPKSSECGRIEPVFVKTINH
jgi:hypothetical protein